MLIRCGGEDLHPEESARKNIKYRWAEYFPRQLEMQSRPCVHDTLLFRNGTEEIEEIVGTGEEKHLEALKIGRVAYKVPVIKIKL